MLPKSLSGLSVLVAINALFIFVVHLGIATSGSFGPDIIAGIVWALLMLIAGVGLYIRASWARTLSLMVAAIWLALAIGYSQLVGYSLASGLDTFKTVYILGIASIMIVLCIVLANLWSSPEWK